MKNFDFEFIFGMIAKYIKNEVINSSPTFIFCSCCRPSGLRALSCHRLQTTFSCFSKFYLSNRQKQEPFFSSVWPMFHSKLFLFYQPLPWPCPYQLAFRFTDRFCYRPTSFKFYRHLLFRSVRLSRN